MGPRSRSRQVGQRCGVNCRFMKVLNNSYYSSKYKRDGHYSDGCRSLPASASEIGEFLREFTENTRRYSIENKLSSYEKSSKVSPYHTEIRTVSQNGGKQSGNPGASTFVAPSMPPPPPPKKPIPQKEMALVLYDITQEINPNVLECREGDRIVIEEDFGDWIRATMNGREGFVPYNYIERLK